MGSSGRSRHGVDLPPGRRLGVAGAVVLVLAAACSASSGDGATQDSGDKCSTTSSPFTVGPVPAGYEPETAGIGTAIGDWGQDSFGTVEPYTVLSPDGRATGPGVVLVSITGYAGYQGGLGQSSHGYMSKSEELTIDGSDAVYAPATDDVGGIRWADLVVVRGDDLAVRVSSPHATSAELTAIAARVVVPRDHTKAPTVPDPPHGLHVVGSVDVDGVLASDAYVAPHTDQVPGPTSAHAAGWLRAGSDGADQLSVLTLPGRSLDLAAVPVHSVQPDWIPRASHRREVGGRRALVTEETREDSEMWRRRSVLVEAAWGDVVVVSASGQTLPAEEELVALAASVQPTDDATWERFVVEATGGPGIHADRGRHELARGRVGELEWLLQDGPPDANMLSTPETDPHSLRGVDPCLKLSNRNRACTGAMSGGGGPADWFSIATGEAPAENGFSFVVLTTPSEAAAVRITTSTASATAALVAVPAGGLWAAVVFVPDPGSPTCDPAVRTLAPHQMSMEALDAAGVVLRCLGGLPQPSS